MRYETSRDIEREKRVLDLMCKKFKCSWTKMPNWDIDAMMYRNGKAVAWAEVKTYTYRSDKYPTCILSMRKLGALLKYINHLPVFLILSHRQNRLYKRDKNKGRNYVGGQKRQGWGKRYGVSN